MPAPLAFQLNLTGNFAAQLAPVNAGLGATERGTHKAAEGVRLFEGELGKLQGAMGPLSINLSALHKGGSLFTFDLAEGIRGGVELVSKLAEGFVDLGKEIVTVAGRAQDLALAERLNLGTEGAKGLRALAEDLSNVTRHDDDTIRRALLPVMRAGLKEPEWLRKIAIAGADVEAITAGDVKLTDAVHAIGKIATKREFNAKLLQDFGLNVNDTFKNLGDLLHTSPKEAKKLAEQGKVAGLTLVSVILDELQKKQGGSIGGGAFEANQTMGATLQRLRDLPENMFKSLADSPALKGLQAALEDFIAQMKGPTGMSLMGALADALRASVPALELLAKALTYFVGGKQEDIDRAALNAAGVKAGTFGGKNIRLDERDTHDALKRAGLNGLQINDLFAIYGEQKAKQVAIAQVTKELGGAVGSGFLAGINAKVPTVAAAGDTLAGAAIDGVVKKAEIHSPSRVGVRLGMQFGEGIALGIEGRAGRVGAAYDVLGGVPAAGGAGGGGALGGTGGMAVMWTGNVIVQASGGDAHAIGEAASQGVRREWRLIQDEVYRRLGGAQ